MAGIKIATDSTADLPLALIKEYNIAVIPLKVFFGKDVYREGIDITPSEFFGKLAAYDQLPATSQPSPGEFQNFYEDLTKDGSAVISIHISSLMSGTSQSALIAKSCLPDKDITIIDSKQVSMALGIVVLAAARAAKAGKRKEEIIDIVHTMIEKVQTYFVVDTLEYLEKGGRIGKAVAFLGTMLNIKPVLTIEDGLIAPCEKIRGKGKALEHIIGIAKDYTEKHGQLHSVILHGNVLNETVKFHQRVSEELKCPEIIIGDIGAVVGTHAGPGIIALFFYGGILESDNFPELT
jgi:DegV family protein with EDD domain